MSHFSQTALPYEHVTKQVKNTTPSEGSIDMANAFIQVCKYHQGDHADIIYDADSSLYYTLFVDNEGSSIINMKTFIQNNKHLIIQYLEQQYCAAYQSKTYFKKKKNKWEKCSTDEIIYALSTNHESCLQQLDYASDGFIWITYMNENSGDPCDPHEASISETLQKKNIHTEDTTFNNEWKCYTDGVIGSVDY